MNRNKGRSRAFSHGGTETRGNDAKDGYQNHEKHETFYMDEQDGQDETLKNMEDFYCLNPKSY